MALPERNLDVLQNLEATIAGVWRKNPAMTDYVALRAYEGVFAKYRAEARGHAPQETKLAGLDAIAFEEVKGICEFRLGRAPLIEGEAEKISPIPIEELLDCLRQLIRSVERHTKMHGRQGYLTFIDRFV